MIIIKKIQRKQIHSIVNLYNNIEKSNAEDIALRFMCALISQTYHLSNKEYFSIIREIKNLAEIALASEN